MNMRTIGIGIVAVALILAISLTASAANPESSGNNNATGGTITNVDHAIATAQTQHWAGFYGNVSGTIRLGDTGSEMYKWNSEDVGGEVYASTANSITWASIAGESGADVDSSVSYLSGASDSATITFAGTNSADITVGTNTVASGAASATHTFVNGSTQSASFEEAILTDGTNIVWTALISPNTDGFESGSTQHDYQMIVPENEEGGTAATTYYFFVELE